MKVFRSGRCFTPQHCKNQGDNSFHTASFLITLQHLLSLVQTIDNCKWANSDNILIILSVSCWYRRQVIDWQHPSQQQQPLFSVAMLELLMSVQLMDRDQSREVEEGRDKLRWTENMAKQQHSYLHFQFYSFSNFSPPRVVSLWLLWKTYYKLQLIFIIHTALTFWRG